MSLLQFRFCNISVVCTHGYGNSHELTKHVDMVTLQRSLLFIFIGAAWYLACLSQASHVALMGLLGTGEAKLGQGVRGRGGFTVKARAGNRQCGRVGSSLA